MAATRIDQSNRRTLGTLRTGTVQVSVSATSGSPLGLAAVSITHDSPPGNASSRAAKATTRVRCDTSGHATLDVLPGTYRVSVELPGHATFLGEPFEVRAGATTMVAPIALAADDPSPRSSNR